ncbi:MAG: tyrosine-protein phosphatase [Acidobacteria bacterium]|nr:tyrosine-protein phosphatase [Acidobacteriota bacterium]
MIAANPVNHPFRISKNGLIKLGILAFFIIIIAHYLSKDDGRSASFPANVMASNQSTANAILLTSPSSFPNIRIKNFGKMDEAFYRGAQPKPNDYQALATLGIKTIIDLRDDPTRYEKPEAEAAGIKYVNIPMSDKRKPADDTILAFFNIANDQANQPFFVHCAGGRHRTGLIGAVYRFDKYHWDFDQAYQEMKNYDYYSRWGHGDIKDYVQDYYQRAKFIKPLVPEAGSEEVKQTSKPVTMPPPPKPTE